MIVVEKNEIIQNFFNGLGLDFTLNEDFALKNFVQGLLVNERASIKDIAENTIHGLGERQMNRAIHQLSMKSDDILLTNLKQLQTIPGLKLKSSGVISLDEHIIPKTGTRIEGVDYFHVNTGDKNTLGLSMISTHYYGGIIEYPIDREIYRRIRELEKYGRELEKYGKASLYRSKNEIARELIQKYAALGTPCKTWVMDSYFMTKENVQELTSHGFSYISKIKRNWVVTFHRKRWNISELYAHIPDSEYELVKAVNPKNHEKKHFLVAHRDVFIKKIGNHHLIFLKELETTETGEFKEKYRDGWTCLVSNIDDGSPKEIVQTYMKRWTIETSYRDDTQELHLKGCMWRNIEGQYCFISLVFLAYRLLVWAHYMGFLGAYNSELRTIGQKHRAFQRFSDELFGIWINKLHQTCKNCQIADIIHGLIYGIKVEKFL